jgi:hypothetical protein
MNLQKLNEMFAYDCGHVIRKTDVNYRAKAGDVVGTVDRTTGYVRVNFDGKVAHLHRLVWALVHGEEPQGFIDHINGDRADNRVENLRVVDNSINMQNIRRARIDSSTGILGASPCSDGRYVARIRVPSGSYRSLGRFSTAEEAGDAYLKAKRELHPGCTI